MSSEVRILKPHGRPYGLGEVSVSRKPHERKAILESLVHFLFKLPGSIQIVFCVYIYIYIYIFFVFLFQTSYTYVCIYIYTYKIYGMNPDQKGHNPTFPSSPEDLHGQGRNNGPTGQHKWHSQLLFGRDQRPTLRPPNIPGEERHRNS